MRRRREWIAVYFHRKRRFEEPFCFLEAIARDKRRRFVFFCAQKFKQFERQPPTGAVEFVSIEPVVGKVGIDAGIQVAADTTVVAKGKEVRFVGEPTTKGRRDICKFVEMDTVEEALGFALFDFAGNRSGKSDTGFVDETVGTVVGFELPDVD